MLHVGVLLHDSRMLAVLRDRREDEFVILLAVVLQDETDLLALPHLDACGLVAHLPAALEHLDLDDARRLVRIARLASREGPVILMGGRRNWSSYIGGQQRSDRHQQ